MFKKEIYFILIFLLWFLIISPTFAADDCENKNDAFDKYECRVEKVCKEFDENKKVFNPEKYKQAEKYKETEISDVFLRSSRTEKPIKKAVSVYKENMNNIYKCSMIGIQKNSILKIKWLLKLDKTWEIWKSIDAKITNIISKLDMVAQSTKCLGIDKKTIYNKLSILRQTTYETCKFWFYTDYLKEYYSDPANALGMTKKDLEDAEKAWESIVFTNTEAADAISWINKSLDTELNQAYKTFPVAFHAYSEYENNYPIHFLLELLKTDFMVFRDNLHQMINPINQVWYKIVNAMLK